MTLLLSDIIIEPMRRKHVDDVVDIENKVYPQPWSSNLFLSEIVQPTTRDYTVAFLGDQLVGYSGVVYIEPDAHVTTIAVDPMFQGRGIASRMMLHNASLCRQRGMQSMTLEVRVSNEPAQALYRNFGFAPAGVRPKYYSQPTEDALIMWAHDIDSEAFAERLRNIEEALA
jgi:ribosomal-protein-alanine N-acetyltransferase